MLVRFVFWSLHSKGVTKVSEKLLFVTVTMSPIQLQLSFISNEPKVSMLYSCRKNVYSNHEQSRSRLLLIAATGGDVLEHISVVTTPYRQRFDIVNRTYTAKQCVHSIREMFICHNTYTNQSKYAVPYADTLYPKKVVIMDES